MGSDGTNRNIKAWGHRVKEKRGAKGVCVKTSGERTEKEGSGGHGSVPSRQRVPSSDYGINAREIDQQWCHRPVIPALKKLRLLVAKLTGFHNKPISKNKNRTGLPGLSHHSAFSSHPTSIAVLTRNTPWAYKWTHSDSHSHQKHAWAYKWTHSYSRSHQKHAVGIQVDPQLDAVDDLLSGPLRDPKIGDQGHDRDSKEPVGRVRVDSYQCPPTHVPTSPAIIHRRQEIPN